MIGTRQISTRRFGSLVLRDDEIIYFPCGLVGLSDCRHWTLLAGQEAAGVAWLQSVDCPELALAVTSPQRLVPGYRIQVAPKELELLELSDLSQAELVVVLGRNEHGLTANLRAPIVLHPARRLGRQVVAGGDLPVQFLIETPRPAMRRSA